MNIEMVFGPHGPVPDRNAPEPAAEISVGRIDRLIADIDAKIGRVVDAILHHPDFQALEAAWRGLHFVVERVAFEQNIDNVRRAVQDMRIEYPVALDNDYAIWRAFHNQYWPALYFIDAQGHIRHHQFGEGDYDQSERILQRLLAEAGTDGAARELVSINAGGVEAAADARHLASQENYVGYARTEGFASPGGAAPDARRIYAVPARLKADHWALAGDWTMGKQATVLNQAGGRIAYRFHARDLHLVMGTAAEGKAVPFRVLLDGKPPGAAHGLDLDPEGRGTLSWPRLYQLVRQAQPIADRQFEIEFLDPGAAAYAFTFG